MFFSCDAGEMARQVHQILEAGSSKDEMIHGVRGLGGLWASARLRFRDLPGCELSAAWAKLVGKACDSELETNKSWLHKLRRESASSGEILEIEEHIQRLEFVKLEKWLDIELQL